MRHAVIFAALLALAAACASSPEPGAGPSPTAEANPTAAPAALASQVSRGSPQPSAATAAALEAPSLAFTVAGGGFGTVTFGPRLDDPGGHWLFDRRSRQTEVHLSGTQGTWRAGLDLTIPLRGPGRYEARSDYQGIDRRFIVSLANHATGERLSLVAVVASVDLTTSPESRWLLEGTFAGKFAVGRRSSGRDVLDTPMEKRVYATVTQGRFAVGFRDTLRGRGRLWPEGASAVLDRRKGALRGSSDRARERVSTPE